MPFVNIKLAGRPPTAEQKAVLIKGVTGLLADVPGKNPETTVVIIEEVPCDNWGINGESVTARNSKQKS